MSDSETFLSRWLRLKRNSAAASPAADAASPAAFDPASLPSIESIVADSDIQPFLREGVPAELTRAALRSAWTADPAIRDFVGIAENQWNFNEHHCIPGFGPLEAADYLAARVLGNLTSVAQEASQDGTDAEQANPPSTEPAVVRSAPMPPVEKTSLLVESVRGGETGGEAVSHAAAPRSHGGALPR
jgi:hypothetical protein